MQRRWINLWLAGMAAIPTTLAAQTLGPTSASPAAAATAAAAPARPAAAPVALVEGKPVEARPPEKADDKPAFSGQTRVPYHASLPFTVTTLASKLNRPWSFAFLPDGKILVTEKPGAMRTLDAQGVVSEPITGVPPVLYRGEVGLLDVALDPDFARNRRLFFTFNEASGEEDSTIAVARARLDPSDRALSDVTVIFRASPAMSGKTASGNQGGRMAIGKDGVLFVSLGDRSRSPPGDAAQNLTSDLGKIVRITADGKPAPGNPFSGRADARPEIWSLGHRNPEGLAIDPHGQLWEVEHGPRGGDELNKIAAGKNYGWPVIVHGIDDFGAPIGAGLTEKAGMEQPRYYWDPVIAPSGLAFYSGALFPQWKNSIFVGALRGAQLDRLTLAGDKVVSEEPLLRDMKARIRDVRVGPEGAVYVLTDSGLMLKITPK